MKEYALGLGVGAVMECLMSAARYRIMQGMLTAIARGDNLHDLEDDLWFLFHLGLFIRFFYASRRAGKLKKPEKPKSLFVNSGIGREGKGPFWN